VTGPRGAEGGETARASCPDASAAYRYGYDADGNLTTQTITGTTTTFSVNPGNEVTTSGFGYDGDGSMTADPGVFSNAGYTQLEQMSSVTPTGGSPVSMAYTDVGQARRVTNGTVGQTNDMLGLDQDTSSGTTTSYIQDPSGTILGERETGRATTSSPTRSAQPPPSPTQTATW